MPLLITCRKASDNGYPAEAPEDRGPSCSRLHSDDSNARCARGVS